MNKQAVRTCNSYWNPQDPIAEYDIDDFILGMSSQVTEREDTIITPDLRGKSYCCLNVVSMSIIVIASLCSKFIA